MVVIRYLPLFFALLWPSYGISQKKRVLLHGSDETATAIQLLTTQVNQLMAETTRLNLEIHDLKSHTGSIYTRWGRTVCPANGTMLIYNGFAAGNSLNAHGPADFMCLSADPVWAKYDDSSQGASSMVYGTEYEFSYQFSDGGAKLFGQNLQDHDAPCAVCLSSRSLSLMIPGRSECYPGWTKEYAGYIVSGAPSQISPTNYICLDQNAETERGDARNDNGKVVYLVEAACGSLPCPPYVQNREIPCVVCTK
ncbi:uncharacterized protein LOC128215225 [Mya arenaria]|uniref:uncharacterized protein LOC128215225 n=1 Tax=Mya arenaria TaxID=6604 RepID=UPI0022E8BE61|nr:uncharacterized protein LOC128215225 [Mya arenaria]